MCEGLINKVMGIFAPEKPVAVKPPASSNDATLGANRKAAIKTTEANRGAVSGMPQGEETAVSKGNKRGRIPGLGL